MVIREQDIEELLANRKLEFTNEIIPEPLLENTAQLIQDVFDHQPSSVSVLLKQTERSIKLEKERTKFKKAEDQYHSEINEEPAQKTEADKNSEKKNVSQKIGKSGVYQYVDGEVKLKESDPRKQAAYSNWDAGNADPEDLEKHKQLLDRQYFGGPIWDGKPKPVKAEDDVADVIEDYEDVEGETHPENITDEQRKAEGGEDVGGTGFKTVQR